MRPLLRSVACCVSSLAFLACGAAPHEAQAPRGSTAAPPPAAAQQSQGPGYAQPTATQAPGPAAAPVAPLPLFPGGEKNAEEDEKLTLRTREQSLADLVSSEKAIFLSAPDCATACRALRSMTRAAGRACEPPAPPTNEVDCKEIGARVGRAKTRVTEVCGVCPDGPP